MQKKNYFRAKSATCAAAKKWTPRIWCQFGKLLHCIEPLLPNAQCHWWALGSVSIHYLPRPPPPPPVPCGAFDFHTLFDCCATVAQHSQLVARGLRELEAGCASSFDICRLTTCMTDFEWKFILGLVMVSYVSAVPKITFALSLCTFYMKRRRRSCKQRASQPPATWMPPGRLASLLIPDLGWLAGKM